jgi:N-acetylglucosamine-6-sulfatase
MHRRAVAVAWLVVLTSALVLVVMGHPAARAASAARPNVIVLMTDDQTYDDLSVMPRTRRLLGSEGTTFQRAYVSYPLCCPSRATFLTGEYAHNHRVFGNKPPIGGYGRLDATRTLPVSLQLAGYATTHIGKYLNGYGSVVPATIPPGWTDWHGAVDPTTYRMWGYTLIENGVPQTYGTFGVEDPALYQTDVYRQKAIDAIRAYGATGQPYFLSVAFLAPHMEQPNPNGIPVRPAPRHRGRMSGRLLRFGPAFNEADVSDKPRFIRKLPALSPAQRLRIDRDIHARRESLIAVDQAVEGIVDALRATGQLRNTYILFTSDNGYLEGEHRIRIGKFYPYDAATHVPMLMRGPGIRGGGRSGELVSNVDLAPTILDITGARPTVPQDGRSLVRFARDPALRTERPILHEGLQSSPDGDNDRDGTDVRGVPLGRSDYMAVRTSRYLWIEHGDGEHEFYDLLRDPFELESRPDDKRYESVRRALGRILPILRTCRGASCRAQRPLAKYSKEPAKKRQPAAR